MKEDVSKSCGGDFSMKIQPHSRTLPCNIQFTRKGDLSWNLEKEGMSGVQSHINGRYDDVLYENEDISKNLVLFLQVRDDRRLLAVTSQQPPR